MRGPIAVAAALALLAAALPGCTPPASTVEGGKLAPWELPGLEPPVVPSLLSSQLAWVNEHEVWIAGDGSRLVRADLQAGVWKSLPAIDGDHGNVLSASVDRKGRVWTVQGSRVGLLDASAGTFKALGPNEGVPERCYFDRLDVDAAPGIVIQGTWGMEGDRPLEFDEAGKRFIPVDGPPGKDEGLQRLAVTDDGTRWLGRSRSLFRLASSAAKQADARPVALPISPKEFIGQMVPAPGGVLWIVVSTITGGIKLEIVALVRAEAGSDRIVRTDLPQRLTGEMKLGPDGKLWIAGPAGAVQVHPDGRQEQPRNPAPTPLSSQSVAYFAAPTVLKYGTRKGDVALYDLERGTWSLAATFGGLPGNALSHVHVTSGSESRPVAYLSRAWRVQKNSTCFVSSVLELDQARQAWVPSNDRAGIFDGSERMHVGPTGTRWSYLSRVGLNRAVYGLRNDGIEVTVDLPSANSFRETTTVLEDRAGTLWILDVELLRCPAPALRCNRIALPTNERPGRPAGTGLQVLAASRPALVEDHAGHVWARTSGALFRINRNGVAVRVDPPAVGPDAYVQALGIDPRGRPIALAGGRVFRQEVDTATVVPQGPPALKSIDLGSITADRSGALWLVSFDAVGRWGPGLDSWRWLQIDRPSPKVEDSDRNRPQDPFVDDLGDLWYSSGNTIARQQWLPDGTPRRPVNYYLSQDHPRLVAIEAAGTGDIVWELRRTGLLRRAGAQTTAFRLPTDAPPVTALQAVGGGAAWLGQAGGGLAYYDGAKPGRRIADLPDDNVRAVAVVPGGTEGAAWVATDGGAALVTSQGVQHRVTDTDGPVDLVAALGGGGAWLVLNPISAGLYLDPSLAPRREQPRLRLVDGAGKTVRTAELPGGRVLSIATGSDGRTVWLGTTRGLFRLEPGQGQPQPVNARGRLDEAAVSIVAADPAGTVWMGVAGASDQATTRLVGFRPDVDDIDAFTEQRGFPRIPQIESLAFGLDGDLVVSADRSLFKGRVFVPSRGWSGTSMALVATALLLVGVGAGQAWRIRQDRKAMSAAYAPVAEATQQFFTAAGLEVTARETRQLRVGNDQGTHDVVLAHRSLLAVEDVIDAHRALFPEGRPAAGLAYLVYPGELDPAARRQLDVYRVREGHVIVPVPLPLMRAKLQEGPGATRVALDQLRRRYLGQQDLFDVRNALDEPRFFFGRRSLLDEMHSALGRNEHVALIGPRKAGKSSVLNLLRQRLDTFPVVKIDLELYGRSTTDWPEVFLGDIVDRYDTWGRSYFGADRWNMPAQPAGRLSGSDLRRALLSRRDLRQALGNHQPLVLLLDEIERVFPNAVDPATLRAEADRYNRAAGALRALAQEGGDALLSIVIADLRPSFVRVNSFQVAGAETNPLYRFLQERYVTPLENVECSDMLVEIGQAMGLTLDPAVQARIFDDSGGHAGLARQLASMACRAREGATDVMLAHYEAGLLAMEDNGAFDEYFRMNFWQQSTEAEQRVLLACAAETGAADDALSAGAGPQPDPLLEARRWLSAVGVLQPEAGGHRVAGARFRAWLREMASSS